MKVGFFKNEVKQRKNETRAKKRNGTWGKRTLKPYIQPCLKSPQGTSQLHKTKILIFTNLVWVVGLWLFTSADWRPSGHQPSSNASCIWCKHKTDKLSVGGLISTILFLEIMYITKIGEQKHKMFSNLYMLHFVIQIFSRFQLYICLWKDKKWERKRCNWMYSFLNILGVTRRDRYFRIQAAPRFCSWINLCFL